MSSVATINISGTDKGTDNDFDRPSATGVFLYRYPGTSYLATIVLSIRDKIHSSPEALLKLTLMGFSPADRNKHGHRPTIFVEFVSRRRLVAISEHPDPFDGDKAASHHLLQFRQESLDVFGLVRNLHHDRQIQGKSQDM
jgi:hypothetical protein